VAPPPHSRVPRGFDAYLSSDNTFLDRYQIDDSSLLRGILREEERMQKYLGDLLRDLSVDMAHDEIPVSEIDGPAARRSSPRKKPAAAR